MDITRVTSMNIKRVQIRNRKLSTGARRGEAWEKRAANIFHHRRKQRFPFFLFLSLFPLFLTRGVRLRVNETKGNENNNNNNNNNNRENVVFDVTFQLIRDLVEHGGEKERRGWNNNRGKWREWEKKERKDKNRQIRNRVIIGNAKYSCTD